MSLMECYELKPRPYWCLDGGVQRINGPVSAKHHPHQNERERRDRRCNLSIRTHFDTSKEIA